MVVVVVAEGGVVCSDTSCKGGSGWVFSGSGGDDLGESLEEGEDGFLGGGEGGGGGEDLCSI